MHTIYIDGGSNGYLGDTCFKVFVDDKVIHTDVKRYTGEHTNNQMEYTALINALEWCKANLQPHDRMRIKTDSQLVHNQIKGLWRVKDVHLKRAVRVVHNLMEDINNGVDKINIIWTPRETNLAGIELERVQKLRKKAQRV